MFVHYLLIFVFFLLFSFSLTSSLNTIQLILFSSIHHLSSLFDSVVQNERKQKQHKSQKLAKKYTKLLDSSEKQQKQRILSKSVLDSLRSNDKNRFTIGAGYDPNTLLDASNNDDESNYDDNYEDDNEDPGTIHPYGPNIDPTVLLNSLTEQEETKILSFNSNAVSHIARSHNPVANKGGPLAPIPGEPRNVKAEIIKPRFVTLSWQEPYKNADEITSYSILYKLSTSER